MNSGLSSIPVLIRNGHELAHRRPRSSCLQLWCAMPSLKRETAPFQPQHHTTRKLGSGNAGQNPAERRPQQLPRRCGAVSLRVASSVSRREPVAHCLGFCCLQRGLRRAPVFVLRAGVSPVLVWDGMAAQTVDWDCRANCVRIQPEKGRQKHFIIVFHNLKQ